MFSKKGPNSSFHPFLEEDSLNPNLIEDRCSSLLAPSMKQVVSSPSDPSLSLLPNTCNQIFINLLTRGVIHLTNDPTSLSHNDDFDVESDVSLSSVESITQPNLEDDGY